MPKFRELAFTAYLTAVFTLQCLLILPSADFTWVSTVCYGTLVNEH